MGGLDGWGASPTDTLTASVEVTHRETGETRTFRFEAPTGRAAQQVRRTMADPAGTEPARLVRACCPELHDEPIEAVERLVWLTGGYQSPLHRGVATVLALDDPDREAEEDDDPVQNAVPFSYSSVG